MYSSIDVSNISIVRIKMIRSKLENKFLVDVSFREINPKRIFNQTLETVVVVVDAKKQNLSSKILDELHVVESVAKPEIIEIRKENLTKSKISKDQRSSNRK